MIPFSERSVVASSVQEAVLQSGPPQPVVTANRVPDLDDGLFRQTPDTMIQIRLAPASKQRLRLPDVGNQRLGSV